MTTVVTPSPAAFGPPEGAASAKELKLLEEVLDYNTPQITNVVVRSQLPGTYQHSDRALGLNATL